mmetsp:Transcript_57935/g.104060  ORF Transcript_57935/g.104060 Transcript_57935/m.104060 type:complete len:329 (-) Transcript_57935:989-1975(-)
MLGTEPVPIFAAEDRREVCHYDLPGRTRIFQVLVQPLHLVLPEILEPARTAPEVIRPTGTTAGTPVARVRATNVVELVAIRIRPGVPQIGVHEVIVDTKLWIIHLDLVVLTWHDPAICAVLSSPGPPDDLVPPSVKLESTVVVVSEDTQPRLAIQTRSVVDEFENGAPLARVHVIRQGLATLSIDSTPVEAVPGIEHVVRVQQRSLCFEMAGDFHLGIAVDSPQERALWRALYAVGQLVPRIVSCLRRLPVVGKASPVTKNHHGVFMLFVGFLDADIRQLQAIESCGVCRCWNIHHEFRTALLWPVLPIWLRNRGILGETVELKVRVS